MVELTNDLRELLEGLVSDPSFLQSSIDDYDYMMRAKLAIPEFEEIVANRTQLMDMQTRMGELEHEEAKIVEKHHKLRRAHDELNRKQIELITNRYYAVKGK